MGLLGPAVGAGAPRSPRLQPPRGRLLRPGGGRQAGAGAVPRCARALAADGGGQAASPRTPQLRPGQPCSPPQSGAAGERPETAGLRAGPHGVPGAPRGSGGVGCEGPRVREARANAFAAASDGGFSTRPFTPGRLGKATCRCRSAPPPSAAPRRLRLRPPPQRPWPSTQPGSGALPGSQGGLSARGPRSPRSLSGRGGARCGAEVHTSAVETHKIMRRRRARVLPPARLGSDAGSPLGAVSFSTLGSLSSVGLVRVLPLGEST